MGYIPNTANDQQEMLKKLGVNDSHSTERILVTTASTTWVSTVNESLSPKVISRFSAKPSSTTIGNISLIIKSALASTQGFEFLGLKLLAIKSQRVAINRFSNSLFSNKLLNKKVDQGGFGQVPSVPHSVPLGPSGSHAISRVL